MKNSFDEKILEEANDWINANQKVVLATVIQTWGSSPRPTGSRMIINEKGDFSGSVSGGCVESAVVRESMSLIKDNKPFKKLEFKVSNESAWEIGLAKPISQALSFETLNSNFLNGLLSFIKDIDSLTTADSTHPPETEPEKSPFSFMIILLPVGLGDDPQV